MAIIQKTVFISYRRKNVPWALAIQQNLKAHGFDVFFDYTSINSGDFAQIITENIQARAHFLVLLAPSALEGCARSGDWLRREIEIAMDNQRNIVPIMLEGFDFGAPETVKYLTGKLEKLQTYNGLRLPADYFEEGMERLCDRYLNVAVEAVMQPLSGVALREVKKQEKAVAKEPKVEIRELTAQELFEQGYLSKDPNQQIRYYSQAIDLDPKYAYAYNNRGLSYDVLGQHERAIEDYDKALKLKPEYANGYYNRGLSYAYLSQYERAIEEYDKALKLNPDLAMVYNNRGYSYAALSQYEHAMEDYDKAIQINPELAMAYNNRGNRYATLGQHEKAMEDYDKAIEIDPELAKAYSNRGAIYTALGQHERAIEDYDKALKLNPEYTSAYYNKACCYALQGKLEEVVFFLKQALEKDTDYYCELTAKDSDFDGIREKGEFKKLMEEFCKKG